MGIGDYNLKENNSLPSGFNTSFAYGSQKVDKPKCLQNISTI